MTSGAETIGSVDKILYFDFLCILFVFYHKLINIHTANGTV